MQISALHHKAEKISAGTVPVFDNFLKVFVWTFNGFSSFKLPKLEAQWTSFKANPQWAEILSVF